MKNFRKKELLSLKYEVARRMDSKESYQNMVYIYYTSLEVLQYFDSLKTRRLSQIDLQFWTHANESILRLAPKVEKELLPLFEETMEFEDSVQKARFKCSQPYNFYDWKKYRMLQAEQKKRREHYQTLRQLAGIYLDILSEEAEGEHYQMWLKFYNRLSHCLVEPERGIARADKARLSIPEMEMLLRKFKAEKDKEELSLEVLEYWLPLIDQFERMIAERKAH